MKLFRYATALLFMLGVAKVAMAQMRGFPLSHEADITVSGSIVMDGSRLLLLVNSDDPESFGVFKVTAGLDKEKVEELQKKIREYLAEMKIKKMSSLIVEEKQSIGSFEDFKESLYTKVGGLTSSDIQKLKDRIKFLEGKIKNADRICRSISDSFPRDSRPEGLDKLEELFSDIKDAKSTKR